MLKQRVNKRKQDKNTRKKGSKKEIVPKKPAPVVQDVVWKSGLEVFTTPVIYVPERISKAMKHIDRRIDSGVEFSIYCKSKVELPGVWVDDAFMLPEQDVTMSSIEYKEDPDGYNTVIHKHPGKVDMFSTVDDEYINTNFDVSLLWLKARGFVAGIVNIMISDGLKLQLVADVVVVEDRIDFDIDVTKIHVNKRNVGWHGVNEQQRLADWEKWDERHAQDDGGEADFWDEWDQLSAEDKATLMDNPNFFSGCG
jgi:hypothetical protein